MWEKFYIYLDWLPMNGWKLNSVVFGEGITGMFLEYCVVPVDNNHKWHVFRIDSNGKYIPRTY